MGEVKKFPKRPVPAYLQKLPAYDREAARRGVPTLAIQHANEGNDERERLRQIAMMPELAAFGPGANPLSSCLMFELDHLDPTAARAIVIAARAALTEIGVPGFEPIPVQSDEAG